MSEHISTSCLNLQMKTFKFILLKFQKFLFVEKKILVTFNASLFFYMFLAGQNMIYLALPKSFYPNKSFLKELKKFLPILKLSHKKQRFYCYGPDIWNGN